MTLIGILTGCDSDLHLSKPVHKELKTYGLEPYFISLSQNNIVDSYHRANFCFGAAKYDFILAVGDRTEQIGGVLAAFQNKIPIGHLYAGDLNTVATFDDIHRHAITLYSNIQFCSCLESKENTIKLMRAAGLVPNANYIGATNFDNIFISKLEDIGSEIKPYILILINSETIGDDRKLIKDTITEYMSLDLKYNVIIIKGNGDDNTIEKTIYNYLISLLNDKTIIQLVENRINHEYFLSLIKNCEYFITNSSAVVYEAPALLKREQIIHIGNRNKGRTKIPDCSHNGYASSRVATLIKIFLKEKA